MVFENLLSEASRQIYITDHLIDQNGHLYNTLSTTSQWCLLGVNTLKNPCLQGQTETNCSLLMLLSFTSSQSVLWTKVCCGKQK